MILGYVESLILVICIDNLLRELLKSPDYDMTLYGYERYPTSAYPSNCCFDSFE